MSHALTRGTAALLTVPPLLWAANAVVGRLMNGVVPPATLNFLRWMLAFGVLWPLAGWVLRRRGGRWSHWKRFALLGLRGVGCYNPLQYLALRTSTPLNVTLVASSMPLWMLVVGALFFHAPVRRPQLVAAAFSMAGVLVVLSRGDWDQLMALRLVPGDGFMLLASAAWAWYSWLLTRRDEPERIRADWAAFLLAQVAPGLVWSGAFAALEWTVTDARIAWSWPMAGALVFIALGPAILAYRCWGLGVQRAGPALAAFFSNLTPLFAAVLSAALLGEAPHLYHALAFALIAGGIALSSRGGRA